MVIKMSSTLQGNSFICLLGLVLLYVPYPSSMAYLSSSGLARITTDSDKGTK